MKNFIAIIFLTCVATAGLDAAWRCKPQPGVRERKVVYDDDQKFQAELICGKGNVEHFEETASEMEKRHKERDELRARAAKAEREAQRSGGLWGLREIDPSLGTHGICTGGAGCSVVGQKGKVN